MKKIILLVSFLVTGGIVSANDYTSSQISPAGIAIQESNNLNDYKGKYLFEGLPFEFIEISVDNNALMISAGSQTGELTPMAEADQFDASGQAVVTFKRNANNIVISATLAAQGQEFVGLKETSKMEGYVGKFKLEGLPFDYIEITSTDGKLFYEAGEYDGELLPLQTPDKFDASGKAQITFSRDAKNEVNSISINVQGQDIVGIKEGASSIKDYTGKYKMEGDLPFDFTEVKAMDGKLFYIAGEYNGELIPGAGTDKFDANGSPVTFIRDSNNKVSSFKATVQGTEITGKK